MEAEAALQRLEKALAEVEVAQSLAAWEAEAEVHPYSASVVEEAQRWWALVGVGELRWQASEVVGESIFLASVVEGARRLWVVVVEEERVLHWEAVQGERKMVAVEAVEGCCSSVVAEEVGAARWQSWGATAEVQKECLALVVVAVLALDLAEVEVVLMVGDFQRRGEARRICFLLVSRLQIQGSSKIVGVVEGQNLSRWTKLVLCLEVREAGWQTCQLQRWAEVP